MELQSLLEKSASHHSHLCPRQILGVRMILAGMHNLGFINPPLKKRLMVIIESDGCFADGIAAATNCTIGHRTLRVEDYGKIAAVFVNTVTRQAVRVAPHLDIRQNSYSYAPDEPRHYFAQMHAYQIMPDAEMFSFTPVQLATPIELIISKPAVRMNCDLCGEEIINEREVHQDGLILCYACAYEGYYHEKQPGLFITRIQTAQNITNILTDR